MCQCLFCCVVVMVSHGVWVCMQSLPVGLFLTHHPRTYPMSSWLSVKTFFAFTLYHFLGAKIAFHSSYVRRLFWMLGGDFCHQICNQICNFDDFWIFNHSFLSLVWKLFHFVVDDTMRTCSLTFAYFQIYTAVSSSTPPFDSFYKWFFSCDYFKRDPFFDWHHLPRTDEIFCVKEASLLFLYTLLKVVIWSFISSLI